MARRVSTKPKKQAKRREGRPAIQPDAAAFRPGVRMTKLEALEIHDHLEAALAELSHAARNVHQAKDTLAILIRYSGESEVFDG